MAMNDQQIAEAWVGVLGISAFLDGGTVSSIPSAAFKVQGFENAIRTRLERFFTRTKAREPDIPRISIREVSDALNVLPTESDAAERLQGFPPAVTIPIAGVASNGIRFLRDSMPNVSSKGITNEYKEPSPRDAARFSQCYVIADDPLLALELLIAGQLASKHVDALAVVYPNLYELMREEIPAAMVEVFGGKTDRIELPPNREKQLFVFTRGQQVNPALNETIQRQGEDLQNARPKKRTGGGKPSTEMFDSATDRIAR